MVSVFCVILIPLFPHHHHGGEVCVEHHHGDKTTCEAETMCCLARFVVTDDEEEMSRHLRPCVLLCENLCNIDIYPGGKCKLPACQIVRYKLSDLCRVNGLRAPPILL